MTKTIEDIPYVRKEENGMVKTMIGQVNNYWIEKGRLYMSYHIFKNSKSIESPIDITNDIPLIKYLKKYIEKENE